MLTNIYIFATTILLGTFGVIWKSGDWLNLLVRMILLGLACTGVYLIIRL